jgi:transcriptional regulator with XRE-family HTH domain
MHENRVYSPGRLLTDPPAMPKHATPQTDGFGTRLATLRKTAGYTQQQLADEIGVSRRMVAYYETESEHPPANLLVDLARVLNTSTDDLLGLTDAKRNKPTAISPRLERRVKQIERLAPKSKQQLLGLIDTFIAAEQVKRKAS